MFSLFSLSSLEKTPILIPEKCSFNFIFDTGTLHTGSTSYCNEASLSSDHSRFADWPRPCRQWYRYVSSVSSTCRLKAKYSYTISGFSSFASTFLFQRYKHRKKMSIVAWGAAPLPWRVRVPTPKMDCARCRISSTSGRRACATI